MTTQKAERLLAWKRTGSDFNRDDYTGKDPARPRLFARTYLAKSHVTDRPWYWVLSEEGVIARGWEATVDEAVAQVEAAYARHRSTTG